MVNRSVLVRLIASSIVVATCSIVATAWLTTRSTTNQLRGELKRTLDADNKIYDTLVAYGGTNASWEGVQTELASMSKATGRTITLASQDGSVIASSDPRSAATVPIGSGCRCATRTRPPRMTRRSGGSRPCARR